MIIISKLRFFLTGAGLLLCSVSSFGESVLTVYFIPFRVETYVPITRATIRSLAWEKWTISSNDESSRLINLLGHGVEATFDEGKVRGMVLADNKTYFLDSNGVVSQGNVGIQLNKDEFVKFQDLLRADERQILKKNGP